MKKNKLSKPTAKAILEKALANHRQGNTALAETQYQQLIDLYPAYGDGHNLLGCLLLQAGRTAEAVVKFQDAVKLMPNFADASSNLGMALLAEENIGDALEAINRALQINPQHWNAIALRAEAWQRSGQWERACTDLLLALQLNQQWTDGWYRLATCAENQKNDPLACQALEQIVSTVKSDFPARIRLGRAYLACGRYLQARQIYEETLKFDVPLDIQELAWGNLGNVLGKLGLMDEAIRALDEALKIQPEAEVLWDSWLAARCYSEHTSRVALFESHKAWGLRFVKERPAPWGLPLRAGQPRRIGILSGDLRDHAIARFLLAWLPMTGRSQYTYHLFSYTDSEDHVSAQLRDAVSSWQQVAELDSTSLRETIRDDEIDIVLELSGHTLPNRLRALTERVAPIQATWLGYPATTGLLSIDYRITDEISDPPSDDVYAVEALARLPGGFLCYAPGAEELGAQIFVGQESRFVFGCFNNLSKITPEVIRTFAAILKSCSGSILQLKHFALEDSSVRSWVLARFNAIGVAADRIQLLPPRHSLQAHIECYNEVDLALDTFPYNGTTTTFESLWMGVPVLSLRGDRHAGRVGASILHNLHGASASTWLVENVDAYIERALYLAQAGKRGVPERMALRECLKKSPLMDGKGFAEKIEAEFDRWMARLAQ
ncbi:MAG: tetratricopeptide repeat protein [Desulfobulbaceae bacterium]|nr:tetratricopeptide repeat protein [Desulfobulbaceae bacterium]